MAPDISVVVRTFNEATRLPETLTALRQQRLNGLSAETLIVDSGSADETVPIARNFGCRIHHIDPSEFSFGRSLNVGCEVAEGRYLVFLSGHCVLVGGDSLANLVAPLISGEAAFVYGRQIGREGVTRFSEDQHFLKLYPAISCVPQEGFFCNNAYAALRKDVWRQFHFDEYLTGLEDMALAKRLVEAGHRIGYVAEAVVDHLHEESWGRVMMRFEREAIALQKIMPEIHLVFLDFLRFALRGILYDWGSAVKHGVLMRRALAIVLFRFLQYWGSYRGNHEHRQLSREMQKKYYYPCPPVDERKTGLASYRSVLKRSNRKWV